MSARTRGVAVAVNAPTGRPAAGGDRLAEASVVGAEVVPPARDAVRLVDDEAIDRQPAEAVEKAGRADPLRREVEEAQLAGAGRAHGLGAGRGAHLAVQARGRDAELVEARDLVDHQRDQRRDHDA